MCAAHVTASDRRHRRRCCCATVDRRWVARKAGMFCTATAKVQQELTHELTRAETRARAGFHFSAKTGM